MPSVRHPLGRDEEERRRGLLVRELVPSRRRSGFIEEAVRARLTQLRQIQAVEAAAGAWSGEDRGDPSEEIERLRHAWGTGSAGRNRIRPMADFLLDSDVVIWHLRGRAAVVDLVLALARKGQRHREL